MSIYFDANTKPVNFSDKTRHFDLQDGDLLVKSGTTVGRSPWEWARLGGSPICPTWQVPRWPSGSPGKAKSLPGHGGKEVTFSAWWWTLRFQIICRFVNILAFVDWTCARFPWPMPDSKTYTVYSVIQQCFCLTQILIFLQKSFCLKQILKF